MSLAYPLALDLFWHWLPITSAKPRLQMQQESSSLAAGRLLVADLGSPLWRADVKLAVMTLAESERAEALVEALDGGFRTFLFTPLARRFPRDDPNGAVLGAAEPEIASIGADNRSIGIEGLPAGYQLRAGDFVSFQIGAKHHLHRFAEDVAANGAGVIASIELRAHLRPGAAAGAALTFIDPRTEMMIEPGSWSPGEQHGGGVTGAGFTARQAL